MSTLNRRSFFKRTALSGIVGATVLTAGKEVLASPSEIGQVGTLIDLTRCDGCAHEHTPQCVLACRQKNQSRFPEPEKPILDYWPHKNHEDWSAKRELTNRLTPYNWTYVQKVTVPTASTEETDVFVPRRCMHCENPPCAHICPFSACTKTSEGVVVIDDKICFGGAKCRDVCPWGIPARQAGVGLYLHGAPKYAGGGVMYKCDLCIDRLREGKAPACVDACPQQAILYGQKDALLERAKARAQEINGYVYGEKENGGTSTFYVSPVPFESIHQAMVEQVVDGKPGLPAMPVGVGNAMDQANNMAKAAFFAPVAGMVAAAVAAYRTMKGDE
ncbi:4Fe-4S dicluster domain-containing protein [Heliorestis acidaminivorans]|uniref:4Fe-4S dicluster domain-containing protein n=1 Tax=Heliorestis acidaminivorans TaxID=553427 RepID=A0A6I0ESL1_9FIRM|nr:4Fe-4S dicluster domain-containing protein [Heliorestis acidaminivorans]KAB2951852.1 4Fe-4S dicluster domain-containing protein [Heliorestis acidaminivorans]